MSFRLEIRISIFKIFIVPCTKRLKCANKSQLVGMRYQLESVAEISTTPSVLDRLRQAKASAIVEQEDTCFVSDGPVHFPQLILLLDFDHPGDRFNANVHWVIYIAHISTLLKYNRKNHADKIWLKVSLLHTSIFNSATSSRYVHSGKRFMNCNGSKPAQIKYMGRFVVCALRVFRQYRIAVVIAALLSACHRTVLLPDWSSVPLSGHHPCQIHITSLSSNRNKAGSWSTFDRVSFVRLLLLKY